MTKENFSLCMLKKIPTDRSCYNEVNFYKENISFEVHAN